MSEQGIPITQGTGQSSVASDLVGGLNYQQVKIVDGTIGGSNALLVNPNGSIPVSIIGTVPVAIISGGSTTPNQSVSGTVGASIIGNVPVNVTGGSVGLLSGSQNIGTVGINSGSVIGIIQSSVATVIIGGSIAASFTPPANQSVSGTVTTISQGSVATVIIGGSIAASFTPPANQSVSGTIGASVIGLTPVAVTNTPSISGTVLVGNTITINSPSIYGNISGSVVSFLSSTNASVITVGTAAANQSVSGTVGASIIGNVPITFANQTSAGQDSTNMFEVPIPGGGGSLSPLGAAGFVFNGSNWDRARGNSSIGALVNTGTGSVITVIPGSVFAVVSVIGTIPATQSGAWTASVVGGPITLYAPTSSFVSGVTSVITGTTSVQVLAPAAGGQRNYVTNVLVTNAAAVGTTVQLLDGGNVIFVGFAAASGGGFSASFPFALRQSSIAGNLSALSSIQASVYVSASGYTAA